MPTPQMIDFLIGIALIATLLGVIRKLNPPKSPLIFGLVWFICLYFPSLYRPEAIPYSETILREDRLYTASFGLFLIVGTLLKSILITPKILSTLGAILILLLGYTEFHLQHYSTRFKFWFASTQGNQLAISRVHLADTYTEAGDFKKALELYDEAIRLNPKQRMVHNNRGVVYMRLNQYPEAEQEFLKEMGIEPYQALAMLNLASLKKKQNEIETSKNLLKQLIEIHPRYLPGYQQLIMLLIDQKEFTEAKMVAEKLESTIGAKVPTEIWRMIQDGLTSSRKGP
jgi:tetratricopeptide (TPR) repeat protein